MGKNDSEVTSQTGSVASSTASSKATEGSHVLNTGTFVTRIPLVPLLLDLNKQYPASLSHLGIFIQKMQLFGFAVSPHGPRGSIMMSISHILYAFHLPLWDDASTNLGYVGALTIAGIYSAAIVTLCAWVAMRLLGTAALQTGHTGVKFSVVRGALFLLVGCGFIPVSSSLFAIIVCGEGKYWAFNKACDSADPLQLIHRLLACGVFAILLCVAYVIRTSIYDADCFSKHPCARAHSIVDKYELIAQSFVLVFFHVLHSDDNRRWFHLALSIVCLGMCLMHTMYLPYFQHSYNKMHSGIYLCTSWVALTSFIGNMEGAMTVTEIDFLLASCGSVPAYLCGSMLAQWRISSLYELWQIYFQNGSVTRTPKVYPKGLPPAALAVKYLPAQELALRSQALDIFEEVGHSSDISSNEANIRQESMFLIPYIERIWLETDLELCSRYCTYYQDWTGRPANAKMIEHGCHLFYTYLVKKPNGGLLRMQLAAFTCWHTRETKSRNFALHMHLEQGIARMETSISVRFQCYKLKQTIKEQIGMQDNSHIKVWRGAQKLHREVLNQMSNFWGKLLSSQVDTVHLAVLTNSITVKRHFADQQFRRVLDATADDSVLLSYALFLEQVMNDEENASSLRDHVGQDADFKKTTKFQPTSETASFSNSLHETQLRKLRTTVVGTVFVFLLFLAGQSLFQMRHVKECDAIIKGMRSVGAARSLSQQAAYHSLQACAQVPECSHFVFRDSFLEPTTFDHTRIEDRLRAVDSIVSDFEAHHDYLCLGDGVSTYKPHVAYMEDKTASALMPHPLNVGTSSVERFGLFNLGYEFAAVMRTLGTNGSGIQLLAYKWVEENAGSALVEMYDHSLSLRLEESEEYFRTTILTTTFVYSVGLLIILLVYVLLVTSFEEIDQAKLEALNLFTLIPKPELNELNRMTKGKLHLLDQKSDKYTEQNSQVSSKKSESDSDSSEDVLEQEGVELMNSDAEQYSIEKEVELEIDMPSAVNSGILVFCAFVLVGLSGMFFVFVDTTWKPQIREIRAFKILSECADRHRDTRKEVLSFVQTANPLYLVHYSNHTVHMDMTGLKHDILELGAESFVVASFQDLIDLSDEISRYEAVALRIAASVHGTAITLQHVLNGLEWRNPNTIDALLHPTLAKLSSTHDDLSMSHHDKEVLIQELVNGELTRKFQAAMKKFGHDITEGRELQSFSSYGELSCVAGICVCALFIVASILSFTGLIRNPVLWKQSYAIGMLILLGVVAFCLHTCLDIKEEIGSSDMHRLELFFEQQTHLKDVASSMIEATRIFVATYDYQQYILFWKLATQDDFGATIDAVLQDKEAAEVKRLFSHLHSLCSISICLKVWSEEKEVDENAYGELSGLFWDFKKEEGAESFVVNYPDQAWYTTTPKDKAMSSKLQKKLARNIISSHHFSTLTEELQYLLRKTASNYDEYLKISEDAGDHLLSLSYTWLGVSVGAIAILVVMFILLFNHYLESSRHFGSSVGSETGSTISLRGKVCVLVVGVLFSALYALQVTSLVNFNTDAHTIFFSSKREAGVADAQVSAVKFSNTDGQRKYIEKHRLYKTIRDAEHNVGNLYFGKDRESGDINRLSNPTELFSNKAFDFPICKTPVEIMESQKQLEKGVDIATGVFLATASSMIETKSAAVAQSNYASMEKSVDTLVYALEQSTSHFHTDASDSNDEWFTYFIAVIVFTVVVVFAELIFVFRPVILELLHQDTGTNIMLKMIPSEVRVTVPVIQEYLDLGKVRDDNPMEVISEWIVELSAVPIIAITSTGSVIKFTQGGECVFGWQQSEVVGSNVKLLMPPEYAKHHSGWLQSYMRTGIKKVIGSVRRVPGYRKDGTRFPMEISVREHSRPGEEPVFISTIKDLAKAFELEAARKLNATIQQMSSVPMICIDTLALITVFNRAAERCFGYSSDEAVGQNINMLMTEEHAKHHDGYVAAYLKTGVKKVIDAETNVLAMKKNGQVLPVVLNIKEVRLKEFGSSSLFLGYIHDRTGDFIVEYEHLIHTTISNLNPIPIVSIDNVGNVLSFSDSAEELFGISSEKILNQSVNALMPPDVASKHDMYLSNYLQTGIRNVIDLSREVVGVHATDGEFPISLEVKEVTLPSDEFVFLAFIRDLRQEVAKLMIDIQTKNIEHSPAPIISITDKGIVTTFNPAAVRVFKYTTEDVIGHNVKMLLPPYLSSKHDGYLQTYQQTRVKKVIGKTINSTAKRSDGSIFHISLAVEELVSKITGVAHYIGYLRDIEEEKQLEWITLLNAQINKSITIPIITMDQEGTIQTISQSAERVWKYDKRDVIGKNIKMLVSDEHEPLHDGYLSRYLRSGIKKVIDTKRIVEGRRSDGTNVLLSLWVKEVMNDGIRLYIGYAEDLSEKDKMEHDKALAESVFLHSPEAIIKLDSFGKVREVNSSFAKLTKYEESEILGQNVKMFMLPKVAVRHDEYLMAYRKTGHKTVIGRSIRLSCVTKQGKVLTVELRVEEIREADEDPIFVGFIQDMESTMLRESEQAVSETLSNLCTVAQIAIDNKGTVLRFNRAAETYWGMPALEAIGKNVTSLMPPEYAEKHDGYLRQYRKLGVKTVIDATTIVKGQRLNGEIFGLELRVHEVPSNGVSLFLGFARDVTEERKALVHKSIGESIVERSHEPIIIIDKIGTIQVFNQAARTLWGYTGEETQGQNVKMLMVESTAVKHDGYLANYLKKRQKRVLDTCRLLDARHKDGSVLPVQLSAKEVLKHGKVVYVAYAMSVAKQAERMVKVNLLVTTLALSTTTAVTITQTGTIELWKNGEELFGYSEKEMLGKNIKVVMPPNVAVQHDGYLTRYNKTKVKTVIGKTLRVMGVTKANKTVPIDISIREAVITATDRVFVGNIVDASKDSENERNFQIAESITNMSKSPLIMIGSDCLIKMWNPASEACFGYTEEQALGKNVRMITPPGIRENHDGYVERYLRTRLKRVVDTSKELTGIRRNEDGTETTVPVTLYLRDALDEDGKTIFFGFISDNTEMKVSQRKEKLNNSVLDNAPLPFCSINDVGIIQQFNPAACKIFGYTKQELIGQNIKLVMPPAIAEKHDGYLASYKVTGAKHVIDTARILEGRSKSGESVVFESHINEVVLQDESLYMGYLRDNVQVQQLNEIAVATGSIALTSVAIVSIDVSGKITSMNDATEALLGYTAEESIGQNVAMFTPPQTAVNHDSYIRRYLEDGVKRVVDQVRVVDAKHKSGDIFPVKLRVFEYITDSQHLFFAFVEDYRTVAQRQVAVGLASMVSKVSLSPLITINEHGVILSMNAAAQETFGFNEEHVIDKNIKILMPDEVSDKHDGYLKRFVQSGCVTANRQVFSKQGQPITAETKLGDIVQANLSVFHTITNENTHLFVGCLRV